MLIHGDADDVVPVDALFEATAGLQSAEIPVQWVIRLNLPHSIDPGASRMAAASCVRCWAARRVGRLETAHDPPRPVASAAGRPHAGRHPGRAVPAARPRTAVLARIRG